MKLRIALLAAFASAIPIVSATAMPVPASFESTGDDRKAIETLLHTYTTAVSTKNQALFESILLSKDIPFSGATSAIGAYGSAPVTQNYENFRKAVFEGSPFTQRDQDIHIEQDGPLAQVSLVFVNSSAPGSSWGWKTLQLLKIGGHWKIASEFYTAH